MPSMYLRPLVAALTAALATAGVGVLVQGAVGATYFLGAADVRSVTLDGSRP